MTPTATARRSVAGGIAALSFGDGPPALLLHGIGGRARSCAALGARLAAAGFAAHCWDAPGYGDSADPVEAPDYAAAAVRLLDGLGVAEPAHLIGTSWGGVIATLVAARYPDRVRSLVLADSTRGSATSEAAAVTMRERAAQLAAAGAEAFAAERSPRLLSPLSPAGLLAEVRADMATLRLPGYRAATAMMAASDTGALLAGIAAPTLVLVGEHDRVTGVAESELLASRIPGARLVVVPEAGHAAVQEQPERVAASILSFWGECAPRSRSALGGGR